MILKCNFNRFLNIFFNVNVENRFFLIYFFWTIFLAYLLYLDPKSLLIILNVLCSACVVVKSLVESFFLNPKHCPPHVMKVCLVCYNCLLLSWF